MVKIFIRSAEEKSLGITEAQTKQWRQENAIPDSDIINQYMSPSPEKRPRTGTTSTDSGLSVSDKHQTPKRPRKGT
jgi:hypothetical protein